jgi:polysaccharide export outer membrane protein
MKPTRLLLTFALSFLLISCGSTTTNTSAPAPVSGKYTDYKLGVGDQITVNVWRNPELSLAVPVRPDGMISMPLVGDTQAAGLSASELSTALQDKLVNFIRNPQVTVIVTDATSTDYQRRVRVTGAVEAPISVPHREGMTVLDLVLEAGGLTEFALANRAALYRKTSSGVEAYSIRLGDILNRGELSTNYELAPSDIITIPERAF